MTWGRPSMSTASGGVVEVGVEREDRLGGRADVCVAGHVPEGTRKQPRAAVVGGLDGEVLLQGGRPKQDVTPARRVDNQVRRDQAGRFFRDELLRVFDDGGHVRPGRDCDAVGHRRTRWLALVHRVGLSLCAGGGDHEVAVHAGYDTAAGNPSGDKFPLPLVCLAAVEGENRVVVAVVRGDQPLVWAGQDG
jgi:hypothetical protein